MVNTIETCWDSVSAFGNGSVLKRCVLFGYPVSPGLDVQVIWIPSNGMDFKNQKCHRVEKLDVSLSLLVKPKGWKFSPDWDGWMYVQTSGRPQRTHSWAILAACLGMLPCGVFSTFLVASFGRIPGIAATTFSSCWGLSNPGRSRYVRFLVLALAIRVVKSRLIAENCANCLCIFDITCWTASPPKIGTAS